MYSVCICMILCTVYGVLFLDLHSHDNELFVPYMYLLLFLDLHSHDSAMYLYSTMLPCNNCNYPLPVPSLGPSL